MFSFHCSEFFSDTLPYISKCAASSARSSSIVKVSSWPDPLVRSRSRRRLPTPQEATQRKQFPIISQRPKFPIISQRLKLPAPGRGLDKQNTDYQKPASDPKTSSWRKHSSLHSSSFSSVGTCTHKTQVIHPRGPVTPACWRQRLLFPSDLHLFLAGSWSCASFWRMFPKRFPAGCT